MPTLKRNHFFCAASAHFENIDVLYYLDADTRVVGEVGDEALPDASHDLVAVQHPGFAGHHEPEDVLVRGLRALGLHSSPRRWVSAPRRGSYESNPQSTAYVGPSEGDRYFMGGFLRRSYRCISRDG